jgi:hypothetical protein
VKRPALYQTILLFAFTLLIAFSQTIAQNVEFVGSYITPGSAYDVYISDNYAYVANIDSSLQIINVTDPANPTLAGSCELQDAAMGVFVSGNYAYVANYFAGLQIIDITNPVNPTIVGCYDSLMAPTLVINSVYVSGNYAFITDYLNGMFILEISDPANPVLVGRYITPWWLDARAVFVNQDYAYILLGGDDSSRLWIINIADPAHPTLSGIIATYDFARCVCVNGNNAYIADGHGGLLIIDVVDPANPIFEGLYEAIDYAEGVTVVGRYAYVADEFYGLRIIDVSNSSNPAFIGSYDTPGDPFRVFVSGNYVYLTDITSLQILRFTPNGIENGVILPNAFSVSQNYPNPFNTQTTIQYSLPRQAAVSVDIFDILGHKIETLDEGIKLAGSYQAIWNASGQSSGIYFYRIKSDHKVETKRMLLLK